MSRLWGLRGKSLIIPVMAFLLALIPALFIGSKAIDSLRAHFVEGYAEQHALLHMQRVSAPISRELALVQRFADLEATRRWFLAPQGADNRERFFEEAEGFRRQFDGDDYYVVRDDSQEMFYDDGQAASRREPRHQLSPDAPQDAWYYRNIASERPYSVRAAKSQVLGLTRVWVSVRVEDQGRVLGMLGAGLNFDALLRDAVASTDSEMVSYVVGPSGELLGTARDGEMRSADLDDPAAMAATRLAALARPGEDREAFATMMASAKNRPGVVQTRLLEWEGESRQVTVGYLPQIHWWLVSTLDHRSAVLFHSQDLWLLAAALLIGLLVLLVAVSFTLNRWIVRPLTQLSRSARELSRGKFDAPLATSRRDEIGELSRNFAYMARRVRTHTEELESRILERTAALEASNTEMQRARRQIEDSLTYASVLQRAILPEAELKAQPRLHYGVLWLPRDQVGGDIFLFRGDERGYLLGVIDCAGHGIPGALMTMLARAIFDNAVNRVGSDDPAGVLNEIDRRVRRVLLHEGASSAITPHMDAGLVWVEHGADALVYAGAKLALYATDGETLERLPGGRRALAFKRPEAYVNQHLSLRDGWTYTLSSDGFLDQAGGVTGYGFGERSFEAMLKRHAALAPDAQVDAFAAELMAYQGGKPQRDDITLLCFRPDGPHQVRADDDGVHSHSGLQEDTSWTS
ncbi:biofilm regulation protein phosphatase SiaA [Halomonas sp. V046]|uniref:biofilm regulation protein phosphatase SiaA n=1 Tax=Halomonas sp. V046 TaxID=3459611 RepID=UPI004043F38A